MDNYLVTKPYKIKLASFGEQGKGVLTVAELQKDIPYNVKRVVWMYGIEDANGRGHHANKETIQTFFCLHGSINVSLTDEAGSTMSYVLESKTEGLVVPPNYWRVLNFTPDAILLVLNSHDYIESDYVRLERDFFLK